MSQYQQLMEALAAARTGYDQSHAALEPLQRKLIDANTQRYDRGLFGVGEAIYDAYRRPEVEERYGEGLRDAMASARGVDDVVAELEAYKAQQARMQQEAEERAKAYEMQGLYQKAGVDPGQAALLARGGKMPQQPKRPIGAQYAEEAGLQPGTPEYQQFIRTYAQKPGTQVNNFPAPEKGYMFRDPNNPALGVVPIPGSSAEREQQEAADKATRKEISNRTAYGNLINVADKALETIDPTTTGVVGAAASRIPGTNRKALEGYLETLKANLGFDRLQQMRAESPTGGALGQVAVQELVALQSTLASLNPDQPPEVLAENLRTVQNHYRNFLSALDGVDPYSQEPTEGNELGSFEAEKTVNGKRYVKQNGQWFEASN